MRGIDQFIEGDPPDAHDECYGPPCPACGACTVCESCTCAYDLDPEPFEEEEP